MAGKSTSPDIDGNARGPNISHRWHILTAVGVYLFIILVECIHLASKLDPDEFFEPSWRALLAFPHKLKLVGMKES